MMRQASVLGSPQAQFFLGNQYEKGIGVTPDLDRARRQFRLCASQGVAACHTGWDTYCSMPPTAQSEITCRRLRGSSSLAIMAMLRREILGHGKQQS